MLILEIASGIILAALMLRYGIDAWDAVRRIAELAGTVLRAMLVAAGAMWFIIQTVAHWRGALLDGTVVGVTGLTMVLVVATTRWIGRRLRRSAPRPSP